MGNRSPWLEQLPPDEEPRPLTGDADTDVVVVGAGIAGAATAFFTVRSTDQRVLLLERDRAARGATGHNAGQLATYFERPLVDIAEELGEELAIEGQRAVEDAHDLLDLMLAECGATVRVERFEGTMGTSSAEHVVAHLRIIELRRRGGLDPETCLVAEDSPLVAQVPEHLLGCAQLVPRARVDELLGVPGFEAVLLNRKGCANGALAVHQVIAHLQAAHPDRFRFADHAPVGRIVLHEDGAEVHVDGKVVTARRVVLCTNGFRDHVVENRVGEPIGEGAGDVLERCVGFMAAFTEPDVRAPTAVSAVRNTRLDGDIPYVYMTRRTHDLPTGAVSLTALGGPERILDDGEPYSTTDPYPGHVLAELDRDGLPLTGSDRAPGTPYPYTWHGLMGYTPGRLRVIGADPRNPVLLYNLGCNGVGFLPSVMGGHRVARLLAGEVLAPSIFDPR